jgi:uncharacterized phage protein gp47/JayE
VPFTRPSLTEIVDRIETDIETRLDDVGSLFRRSVLKILARSNGGSHHLLYGYISYLALQLFAMTADSQYLDTHGSEYGINKTSAVKAVGTGTATGTNGISIPANTELQSSAGQVYTTDSEVTIAAGTATLAFTASIAGADGNDSAGITLTFVSPIAGIDSTVTVSSNGIYGGADEEDIEAYRERILTRKRTPPHGGSRNDYVTWAKEISGVTRAWCLPQYLGNGTVGLAFVLDGSSPIVPTAAQISDMEDYILEHEDPASGDTIGIPVTAEPGFTVLTLTEQSINFNIRIYPNTAVIRSAVESELDTLLYNKGGPGQTIYLSEINESISQSAGEERHELVSPITDIISSFTQVPIMGTVTFSTMS